MRTPKLSRRGLFGLFAAVAAPAVAARPRAARPHLSVNHLPGFVAQTAGEDAQRMYDYWRSSAVEIVALAPKWPGADDVGDRLGVPR